ncbi:reverse transcriptase domain-containing protein [Trichonephila clavipes]|nr:reverse transcriptase domain-containing protein [Trichonephila clavipes]
MAARRVNSMEENSENSDTIYIGELKSVNELDAKETNCVCSPRKVPLTIHNKVKEERSNMVEAGIISKVEEPTEWLLQTSVNYLGHVLSDKGIKPDPKKIRAIEKFSTPTRVCKDFLAVTVSVDAGKNGLRAVLLQEGQPVAYAYVSLTQTQQRYAQIEKELMAVIYGLEYFNYYTHGRIVTVQTDDKPILGLRKNLVKADALLRVQSTTDNFDEVLGQEATVRINLFDTSFTN